MPFPDEWKWLNDLPDAWVAPDEIRKPTRYPDTNLAIQLLSCEFLRHEIILLVGQFITQNANYQLWLSSDPILGLGPKENAVLVEIPIGQTKIVYEAWKRLDDIRFSNEPNNVQSELRSVGQDNLETALFSAVETLADVREGRSHQ